MVEGVEEGFVGLSSEFDYEKTFIVFLIAIFFCLLGR